MNVREYLKDNILLFDGSMGTLYAERAAEPLEKCEEGCLSNAQLVETIHRDYIKAGAKAIKTNTYGANRVILECDSRRLREILTAACQLAAQAASGENVFIFADIGPIPGVAEETEIQYREIVDIFIELGIENFLFETFGSCGSVIRTSEYIRNILPGAFIITSYAINPDGFSSRGVRGTSLLHKALSSGAVDAAGFNCVSGPANLQKLAAKIPTKGRLISIMPNAGFPTVVGNRTIYGNNPAYFSEKMEEIARSGVRILGGCCGTNPEFIREVSSKLGAIKAVGTRVKPTPTAERADETSSKKYLHKLDRGEKIIAVELDPPMNMQFERYIENAAELNDAGVDLITIADCPVARSRMDSSIIACKLHRELGIETLPHLTCRDRNLNATKGLLLGLNMEGVRQVLIVTGDPVPNSERDYVKSVFNFNSRMLASYIQELNNTVFEHPFFICAALNINSQNFDAQLRQAEKKVESGVRMIFTQPVMSDESVKRLKRAKYGLGVKIMGGIMPVVSYKNACFMNNELSGITVPDEITEQYRGLDRETCTSLAVEISIDIAKRIRDIVDGYYIITPFRRTDIVCRIIEEIKSWR